MVEEVRHRGHASELVTFLRIEPEGHANGEPGAEATVGGNGSGRRRVQKRPMPVVTLVDASRIATECVAMSCVGGSSHAVAASLREWSFDESVGDDAARGDGVHEFPRSHLNSVMEMPLMDATLAARFIGPAAVRVSGPGLIAICHQVLAAVAWLHRNGVCHTQIQPSHFFVSGADRPEVALGDLSAAVFLSAGETLRRPPRDAPEVPHPLYLAPELESTPPAAFSPMAADLWATGALLLELAAGRSLSGDSETLDAARLRVAPEASEEPATNEKKKAASLRSRMRTVLGSEGRHDDCAHLVVDAACLLLAIDPSQRMSAESVSDLLSSNAHTYGVAWEGFLPPKPDAGSRHRGSERGRTHPRGAAPEVVPREGTTTTGRRKKEKRTRRRMSPYRHPRARSREPTRTMPERGFRIRPSDPGRSGPSPSRSSTSRCCASA